MAERYSVEVTDAADLEADAIYLWMSERSADSAHAWYQGLLAAYQSLSTFPHRFPEVEGLPGTRRMLYGKYRVLFTVIEPADGDGAGLVRIAHIYHAARG
jgi:plasmid stabilization system protein ParE